MDETFPFTCLHLAATIPQVIVVWRLWMVHREQDIESLVQQRLVALLKNMRASTPRTKACEMETADLDLSRFENLDGQVVPRAVITLRSVGCAWSRLSGGCTMCGHWAGASIEEKPDPQILFRQFDLAFSKVDWSRTPVLCLYNGGSVLNRDEVPEDVFSRILDRIAAQAGIRVVALETRDEYVDEDRLMQMKRVLGRRTIRIAMGLESAREDVRCIAVHKGSSLSRFNSACQAIKRVGRLRLYVLVKPPWLTESEMIDDADAAIRLAVKLGADDIHFEPVTVQRHTLVNLLWRLERYRMPWLWSVIEVLRRVAPTPVYVSPFAHYPRPIAVPHNCGSCDEEVKRRVFEEYNRKYDTAVFDDLHCECREQWRVDLERRDGRTIVERVLGDLPELERILNEEQRMNP